MAAFRAPGSATVRSAPLSLGRSLRPITGPLSSVARFGPRARARLARGAPAKCAGAQLALEGARSVNNSAIYPCPRGSGFGFVAAWLDGPPRTKGLALASQLPTDGGEARARPTPRRSSLDLPRLVEHGEQHARKGQPLERSLRVLLFHQTVSLRIPNRHDRA